ncbi:MAG TPA: M56 family metallopeptidase [Gemmatimonadaceae bacterium]|nr:M56 family metallopeptidase [Gemmatimonadaceae bacterium]
MSAGWLVYALVTGAAIALAASALDGLARARRWPTRWIWAGAMLATLGVVFSAAFARGDAGPVALPTPIASGAAASAAAQSSALVSLVRDVGAIVDSGLIVVAAAAARWVPATPAGAAGVAWLLAVVAALATLGFVHVRLQRARRAWPSAELHGRRVLVAPTEGPAVVGVVRPEIVVPRWLLARDAEEQRLVLAHEDEHVRARDHLLLGGACVAVALMPWHPVAWWSLSRLRLGIELDCDARVLRRGVHARSYGEMLIDLAGQCSGFRVGATALADKTSHLERRLLAMKPITKRFALVRSGALCGAAALSLVVACEARVPTSAEIQSMDVAGAERTAARTGLIDAIHGVKTEFYVNGAKVTAAEAHAVPASDIATVDVRKGKGAGDASVISIRTVATSAGGMKYRSASPDGAPSPAGVGLKGQHDKMMSSHDTFSGIVLIDGARADAAAFHRLDPQDIVAVEIIKGDAAAQLSSEPAAKSGIVKVTTKGARKTG